MERKEGSLHLSNRKYVQKSLGSKKRTFTDNPFVQQTLLKHVLLPRYVLAEGGYQDTTTYCHANDAVIEGTSQQQRTFFHWFDPGIEKETKQLRECEAALG